MLGACAHLREREVAPTVVQVALLLLTNSVSGSSGELSVCNDRTMSQTFRQRALTSASFKASSIMLSGRSEPSYV